MTPASARPKANTKKERLAQEIAKAVGAGRPVAVETVDFNDPNRPKTCLEVDFPILPINQISQIEGNAGKPIYQMSKWWARRRSSVFRAMLLAGAMKAPEDPAQAAKLVWDVYYANHQKKGALKNLRVADIFMGGGTTIVEGSRLGMQMYGCDLNPVAWFIVKNEVARADPIEIQALLAEIEAEVKPQIMPFYACDCPRGHKGRWTKILTGELMGMGFDPLAVSPQSRKDYCYEGPELTYVFWVKYGPCKFSGCKHRTPIITSPIVASKMLTVKSWKDFTCKGCGHIFDVESTDARMAPGIPLYVSESEVPYAVLGNDSSVKCPKCAHLDRLPHFAQREQNKKVELAIVIHPDWLKGSPGVSPAGVAFGGSVSDDLDQTVDWERSRAHEHQIIEVRGPMPASLNCTTSGEPIPTDRGTIPKKSQFECGGCGNIQDVLDSINAYGKTAPVSAYMIQGYCPTCDAERRPYDGRFFAPAAIQIPQFVSAATEWKSRQISDFQEFYPTDLVSDGLETKVRTPLNKYHYTHWWHFFNPRQLLVHASLARKIATSITFSDQARDAVACIFPQYLRANNMFCIWDQSYDKIAPFLSKNNLQPPARPVENSVFSRIGRGNWQSCRETLEEAIEWCSWPWEVASKEFVDALLPGVAAQLGKAKSVKIPIGDQQGDNTHLCCNSATDLHDFLSDPVDLVITDPPFGDIMQYSELSGFFYGWLRLLLRSRFSAFEPDKPPTALEAVANAFRHGEDSNAFYKRVLTDCWTEARKRLKAGGILAFTFHHDKDEPWIAVLESLFDAGFYLESTYPVRSDETKGEGSEPGTFGAQKVEYDVIHVCRKRTAEPTPVSWARMRREVLTEVARITEVLQLHQKAGLLAGDLKVIKRGKALEYYSRHYGKVFVDEDKLFSVRDALIGINQLLDEESGSGKESPPANAEPFTRQFLRLFDGISQQPREQLQMLLRGTTMEPKEYEERGWCKVSQKVYYVVSPNEIAKEWYGKHRRRLTSDYDQAMVLIGASFPNSGISVTDTLSNPNFRPHPALARLLKWHTTHGATPAIRNAAVVAVQLYAAWESQNQDVVQQLKLFFDDGETA
jgi:adenine-specific DNA methylase